MDEEFVTYKVAEKLKEKGFKFNKDYRLDRFFMANEINTPTIAQALRWLREEKGIHLDIGLYLYCYGFDVMQISPKRKLAWSGTKEFPTYESAALAGIGYVLDNLI